MLIRTTCRFDQPDKKKNVQVIFEIYERGKYHKIKAGETVNPDHWSREAQGMKAKYSGADFTNKRLAKKKVALNSIIENQKEFNIEITRRLFERYLESPDDFDLAAEQGGQETGDFHAIVESIIDDHRNEWSAGYKKRFRSIRTKFLDFDPEFTPERLSVDWWRDFVNHCVENLGNVNNTIQTDSKTIQRLIDELKERGYRLPKGLDEITWKYIEPEINSITWEKVIALSELDLSTHHRPTFEDSRVLWCLGALTGRRWGALETMDERNFYKYSAKRWRYKSIGKGLKPLDIPLLPEAIAFLKKIKFNIPRRPQQIVNRDIKEICRLAKGADGKFLFHDKVLQTKITGKKVDEELVEEWQTIHIHTGRHSYAERLVDLSAGEPHREKWVSFMLGHASFATTWKYINRRESSNLQLFDKIIPSKALQN